MLHYTSCEMLHDDLCLMCRNAMAYNDEGTDFYRWEGGGETNTRQQRRMDAGESADQNEPFRAPTQTSHEISSTLWGRGFSFRVLRGGTTSAGGKPAGEGTNRGRTWNKQASSGSDN